MVDECNDNPDDTEESKTSTKKSTKKSTNNSNKWLIRIELDHEEMYDKSITTEDVNFVLRSIYKEDISCIYSDYNSEKIIFRLRFSAISKTKSKQDPHPLDSTDEIFVLKNFQNKLLDSTVIRGIKNINSVSLRKVVDNVTYSDSGYKQKDIWVLDTDGTNLLGALGLDYVDTKRTVSNNITEVYATLGIEAARQCIINELTDVMEYDNTYINYHHISLLCDRITCSYKMISVFRHGINNDNIGPIAKASFEETPEMFLRAARHGELDNMAGVSANVMCGQEGNYGTNCFQIIVDSAKLQTMVVNSHDDDDDDFSEKYSDKFDKLSGPNDKCGMDNLIIANNIDSIQGNDSGVIPDEYTVEL
jgi:DNA-directed RNA polymerase II subunit RPB1